jgi:hypothetical protein
MWIRICDGGMSVDRIGFHQSFVDSTSANGAVYTSLFYDLQPNQHLANMMDMVPEGGKLRDPS